MQLDNRAWLIWGIAASMPAMIGRNPFVLVELLFIVGAVRYVCSSDQSWSWVTRIVAIFVAISVFFNALTVRSGDRAIARIPDGIPIIGGPVTLNAIVYGIVSGLTIFVIVLTWTQVAAHLNWTSLMRQVPMRFTDIAVAGSVAWAYLPSMRRTLGETRETQISRGWEAKRVRDLPALIVPLLAGGLERSLVTAEVLETRGFGGSQVRVRSGWSGLRMISGLVCLVSGTYCLSVGFTAATLALGLIGTIVLAIDARSDPRIDHPTRLHESTWSRRDSICTASAFFSLMIVLLSFFWSKSSLAFNPYPVLELPKADLLLMAGLLVLFSPAVLFLVPQR